MDQQFEGGNEWKLRSLGKDGALQANDSEYLKILKEKLIDPKDDITTADGILEFYKNIKEPAPLQDLKLISGKMPSMSVMKTDSDKFVA